MDDLRAHVAERQLSSVRQSLAEVRHAGFRCWQEAHVFRSCLSDVLYQAVGQDWREGVELLISAGAPVDGAVMQGTVGDSPVSKRGSTRCTTQTPLMLACRRGYDVTARILLTSGAKVNAADPLTCNTALRLAVTHGHVECIKCLIEHGADVNLVGKPYLDLSYTASGIAFFAPHTTLIGAIRQFNDTIIPVLSINQEDNADRKLHRDKWLEVVQFLVNNGADINRAGCHTESSPLVESVESKDTRVLEYLLSSGCYVNMKTHVALRKMPLVDSAITLAVYMENTKAVHLLIQYGADVNYCSEELVTHICQMGYWHCIYLLFIAGIDLPETAKYQICSTLPCSPKSENDGEHYLLLLQNLITSPLPLSMRCRHVLRKQTTLIKCKKALDMGLPKTLMDYIICVR